MRKLISFLLLIYSCALCRLVLSTQWLYKIKERRKTLISSVKKADEYWQGADSSSSADSDTRCLISNHKLNTFSTCVLCGFVIVRLGLVVSQHCLRTDTCLSFSCLFDIFGEKNKTRSSKKKKKKKKRWNEPRNPLCVRFYQSYLGGLHQICWKLNRAYVWVPVRVN